MLEYISRTAVKSCCIDMILNHSYAKYLLGLGQATEQFSYMA